MASFEFDNVKEDKEDALWRYNMERKLKMGLRLTGFLLALFLMSWFWIPTLIPDTVEVAGDLRRLFVSTFDKPLFTFVLLNTVILVVYVLSSQKETTSPPDIYDEYAGSRRSKPTSTDATASPATEETMVDKQIILVENAVALSPVKQRRTTDDNLTDTKVSLSPVKQPMTIVKKTKPDVSSTEVKQKEYLKTRSMVPASQNQRPRDFRRSQTAIIEPPRKPMDEMSSEEFQLSIDSFIAEKKKTLLQENIAHYTRRKEKCMSIVVKN